MLASPGKDVPGGDDWVFEPKYDGIRIVALATTAGVALMTRNGHDKCRQFPEISAALSTLAKALDRHLVLDGEIVALDADGQPGRFQSLQGRMHVVDDEMVSQLSSETPTAFVVFDILVDGSELLTGEEWTSRRKRLERVMRAAPAPVRRSIRASDVTKGSPTALLDEARERRWEGIMAKRRDGRYEPGRRVRHWQKVKLENQQEFVVGGWTEPRNTRQHFGALLLGYYNDAGELVYAGHSGGGFSDRLLADIGKKLRKIERQESPFSTTPKTNERAHWAEPKYVAQVKFNEWTAGGNLRQPTFLGLRDDKDPRSVVREPGMTTKGGPKGAPKSAPKSGRKSASKGGALGAVIEQLRANGDADSATIQIDAKTKLSFTSFGKVFFPVPKFTKG
ncbi:MAG: non-homologous end-joining DNA ligase, partial [Gemmatimonadaceae bacterium]